MAWYRTGTVTVSNGSNVVTGTGTQWAGNVHVGDAIALGSPPQLYEVANVASNTTIGLVTNYTGTSGSGQSYFIAPTQGWIKELADRAAAVIATYANIQQAVDDLEQLTTLISQADAQAGTRTDVQGWSSLRVRQAANAAITDRAGTSANFGTAATQNAQTTRSDRTNPILRTGAGGLLASGGGIVEGVSTPTQDYPIINGFFNSEGVIDPHFGAYPAGIQFGSHTSGSRITQLGGSLTDADHLAFRKKTGDTWGNVRTIYHSGNQLSIGTSSASARAAIQSSVFPAHSKTSMPPIAASINMGVIVSDAVGGRRPFWSDGTDWRDASGTILS